MAIDRTKINPADNTPVNDIELTEQEILNKTLDKDYNVIAVEMLGYGEDGNLKRIATDNNGRVGIDIEEWGMNDYEDASDTISYVGYEKADGTWNIIKIDSTTGYSISWATVLNNATVNTYSDAWTARATLTYGDYREAFNN
jgi:hypothetical protein